MSSKECRICGNDSNLFSVFTAVDEESICDKIKMIANVRISRLDNLPKFICICCIGKLNNCIDIKRQIKFSHRIYYNPTEPGSSDETLSAPEASDYSRKETESDNKTVDPGVHDNKASNPGAHDHKPLDQGAHDDKVLDPGAHDDQALDPGTHTKPVELKRIPSPIPCAQCDFVCTNERTLKAHLQSHTSFKCDLCGKAVASMKSLNLHKLRHTGVKSFACSTCGKAFYTKKLLRLHERTHTGEQPYACLVCRKKFGHDSVMKAHMRLKHTNYANKLFTSL